MLVVSRIAVNAELKKFQHRQALTYSRGNVTIFDRTTSGTRVLRMLPHHTDWNTIRLLPGSFCKIKYRLCKLVDYTAASLNRYEKTHQ